MHCAYWWSSWHKDKINTNILRWAKKFEAKKKNRPQADIMSALSTFPFFFLYITDTDTIIFEIGMLKIPIDTFVYLLYCCWLLQSINAVKCSAKPKKENWKEKKQKKENKWNSKSPNAFWFRKTIIASLLHLSSGESRTCQNDETFFKCNSSEFLISFIIGLSDHVQLGVQHTYTMGGSALRKQIKTMNNARIINCEWCECGICTLAF